MSIQQINEKIFNMRNFNKSDPEGWTVCLFVWLLLLGPGPRRKRRGMGDNLWSPLRSFQRLEKINFHFHSGERRSAGRINANTANWINAVTMKASDVNKLRSRTLGESGRNSPINALINFDKGNPQLSFVTTGHFLLTTALWKTPEVRAEKHSHN